MSSEAKWLGLYNRLGEVLGDAHAETLMNSLVTKDDIAHLATKADLLATRADFLAFKVEILELMNVHQKNYMIAMVSSMVGLTAIFSAVMVVVH